MTEPVEDKFTDLGDRYFMQKALMLAIEAAEADEVPVGAVIVHNRNIIGSASNQTETLKDPTAHAEILAITQAAAYLGDWRLNECTLYVTKEPCVMCSGAIVQSRIGRVVWGVDDPKRGGQNRFNLLNSEHLNHRPELSENLLEEESKNLLQQFFQGKRLE